jgi:hypothetical protein
MTTITVAGPEEHADTLFDRLNEIPVTPATEHLRSELRAAYDNAVEAWMQARRHERTLTAEIGATVDALLAEAAATPRPVHIVDGYSQHVDDAPTGRGFMRAGVDSGQCRWMGLYRVTGECGVRLVVVDAKAGRQLRRWCNLTGSLMELVDQRSACKVIA